MIFNSTYYDREVQEEIRALIGPAFKFREIFQQGGVGSSRLVLKEYSNAFKGLAESSGDLTFASIGLRPKGILVTVSKRDVNIIWAIPYYQLTIYKTEVLCIHSNGQVLKLELKRSADYKFISKILDQKAKYHESITP